MNKSILQYPHFHLFTKALLVIVTLAITVNYFPFAKAEVSTQTQGVWKSAKELKRQGKSKEAQDILEVNFAFNADAGSPLAITSINKKKAFIPKNVTRDESDENSYRLELLNSKGKVTDQQAFTLSREVTSPPPENDKDTRPANVILNNLTFSLSLPWTKDLVLVRVLNENGDVIVSKNIQIDETVTPPAPTFSSVSAVEYLSPGSTGTATTTSSTTLDLAFIGDNYTSADMAKFHADVDRTVSQLLAVEPYKSRASQIMLHYVDNTDDLRCAYSGRLILCDKALTAQLLNTAGVPYDKGIVLINSTIYGGEGGDPIGSSYTGTYGPLVALHELGGHTIGNLSDEYILSMSEYAMPNCTGSVSMPLSWIGLVAPADYTLGCNFPNYHGPFASSLMNILADTWFNVISQRAINQRMDLYTGPFVNKNSPTAVMTSPIANDTVTGLVSINSNLADDQGVVRAELYVDGVFYKTQYLQPFTLLWPSMKFANGAHTVEVRAYDVANNVASTGVVAVTTTNTVDTTKPVVTLTSPSTSTSTFNNGGWFFFYASSTDDSGFVDKLELYKDGVLINTVYAAPYKLRWNTIPETNKGYNFYVKAYDYNGNFATTTTITVTLSTAPDVTVPVATLIKPLNGTIISGGGSISVAGTASDNRAVTKIVLLRDTTILKTCTGTNITSCSTSVSRSNFTTGTHTITEKAYDAAGNMATSVVTVTK